MGHGALGAKGAAVQGRQPWEACSGAAFPQVAQPFSQGCYPLTVIAHTPSIPLALTTWTAGAAERAPAGVATPP